jgi:periplasmic divalent cation tolerance protein
VSSAANVEASALCVVLINAPPAEAPRIARALVERKLAACVNVVPGVTSFYVWDGKLSEDAESTLLVKTRRSLVAAITTAMKELHTYAVPEVVALPLLGGEGNPEYAAWVLENTER